jgi:hypothetical protein
VTHRTTTLTYFGEEVAVDEGIAPLIGAIWKLDIPTNSSCEGDDDTENFAHIGFVDVEGATRFLNVLSSRLESAIPDNYKGDPDYPEDFGFSMLYWRIAPWELFTHSHPRRWRYYAGFGRTAPDDAVRCSVMIDFPHSDLKPVTQIVVAAAEEYRGEYDEDEDGENDG